MKITFPHMGHTYIPVKALLEDLGASVVVPPRPTSRTAELGSLHSPEFACYPMKLNVGNFIEAHESGADTILMAGGVGPCRFGYYAQVQKEILDDFGYNYDMIVLEPPRGRGRELLAKLRALAGGKSVSRIWGALKFGWAKFKALDRIQKMVHWALPREAVPGGALSIQKRAFAAVDRASSIAESERLAREACEELRSLEITGIEPLRVGIVGEIFMVLEPFANLDLERRLGQMGVEVTRSLFVTQWVREHLLLDSLRLRGGKEVENAARPYINHFVGGEGRDTVGETVLYAKKGFDGVIQIAPFTCMPEIVAQSVLPKVSVDHDIPVMTLYYDEHSAEAGLVTRLEAFVDLIERRRRRRRSSSMGGDNSCSWELMWGR